MAYFFILNLFSAFFMMGLIWIIQVVHYPTFLFLSKKKFMRFTRWHQKRISWIVAPIMLIELISSVVLCFSSLYFWFFYVNLGIVISNLLVTFIIQIPIHKKLNSKKDRKIIKWLIKSNWIRTSLWSLRAFLLLLILCLEPI